jgi:hypothetical protein
MMNTRALAGHSLFPLRSVFSPCANAAEQQSTINRATAINRTKMNKRFMGPCAASPAPRGSLACLSTAQLKLSPGFEQDMGSTVYQSGPFSLSGKARRPVERRIQSMACGSSSPRTARKRQWGTPPAGVPTKVDLHVCHVTKIDRT